ncbi:hypothetical protein N7517_008661 [Penicillium concentricum]|uniref:Uncharacterized protein n=1 Tax=Penicillium concentricum TaxID=293559 RepID=A0A9W9RUA6_9EURO|nr:hypothetical protein N7517_008661 [Penicillium concentricum]
MRTYHVIPPPLRRSC